MNPREFLEIDQVKNFREAFDFFDTSKDGQLDFDELDSLFRRVGVVRRKEEIRKILKDVDTDNSGQVDFGEFCVMMIKLRNERRKKKITPDSESLKECLENNFSIQELISSGFTLTQLKHHHPIAALVKEEYWRPLDFRRAAFEPRELRKGGIGAFELRRSGYSLADLRCAGYSHQCIAAVNKKIHQRLLRDDFCLPQRHPIEMADPMSHASLTPRIRHHCDYRPKMSLQKTVAVALTTNKAMKRFRSSIQKVESKDVGG